MAGTPLDSINVWLIGLLLIALQTLAFELGFFAAKRLGKESEKSLTGVLAAALLGLLGLLLAFSFGIVEERYTTRKMLVIDEANAIGRTYLRAGALRSPHAERTRELLRAYIDVRLRVHSVETLEATNRAAEALHRQLWQQAKAAADEDPRSVVVGLFIHSLDEAIDLFQKRKTVALHHRLPPAMLFTLWCVAVLASMVHGYAAGLERGRMLLPTLTLIVSVTAVLLVIIELDRPWQHVFVVSQDAMVSVRNSMSR